MKTIYPLTGRSNSQSSIEFANQRIYSLQLDVRVLKKYTEDLREEIKRLKYQLSNKTAALTLAKETFAIPSTFTTREETLMKIIQLEVGKKSSICANTITDTDSNNNTNSN